MKDVLAEIFTAKFLVINVIIGIAISIAANLITPYVSARYKLSLSWFRRYGVAFYLFFSFLGALLGPGVELLVRFEWIGTSFLSIAKIGFPLWGGSFIWMMLAEKDKLWKDMNFDEKCELLGYVAMGCFIASSPFIGLKLWG